MNVSLANDLLNPHRFLAMDSLYNQGDEPTDIQNYFYLFRYAWILPMNLSRLKECFQDQWYLL